MNFPLRHRGVIALDIDGTITCKQKAIDPEVIAYFTELHRTGWKFIFITGRIFAWAYAALQAIPFPYFLAVQNGSMTLDMPSRALVSKKYLSRDVIPQLEKICTDHPIDFIVYGGLEHDDLCYYRSARFAPILSRYLEERCRIRGEVWKNVSSFDEMPISEFPSLKYFGHNEILCDLASRIEDKLGLHVPIIRDPSHPEYSIAQVTHSTAGKGNALSDYLKQYPEDCIVIAAGDDQNDVSMLDVATCKIVMETAPLEILNMADIIAPSAAQQGIIAGLRRAVESM